MNQLFFSSLPSPPLPSFCSVFRAFSRHESFAPSRTRDASRETRTDDSGRPISMTLKLKTRSGDATRGLVHRSQSVESSDAPEEEKQSKSISRVGSPDQSAFRLPISLRESCLSRRLDSSLPRPTFFIRAESRRVFGHA